MFNCALYLFCEQVGTSSLINPMSFDLQFEATGPHWNADRQIC